MPYKKLDHDSSRLKVCCICWRKATRKLTATYEKKVKQLILDYDHSDPAFPAGICSSCCITLDTRATNNQLPISLEHKAKFRFDLRSSKFCKCRICQIAKTNGLLAKAMRRKAGRTCKAKRPIKVCSHCFIKLNRGIRHSSNMCRSKKFKISNFETIFLQDNKFCEQVTSNVLKIKKSDCNNEDFKLATLGRPMNVSINNSKKKHDMPQLTSDELITIKSNGNFSDKKLLYMLRNLRLKWGRKVIESNVRQILINRKKLFKDLFTLERTKFNHLGIDVETQYFVYCNNIQAFIEHVCCLRGKNYPEMRFKIGFDMGKGFLKLTLTMYDEIQLYNDKSDLKRVSRSGVILEGHKRLKETGVQKLFIIGIAPKIPENYHNCSIFFKATQVNDIAYHFSTDLKMMNICVGLGAHSSKHPCPYCEGTAGIWESDARIRTLESIQENYDNWSDSSGIRKDLKMYFNCCQKPLIGIYEEGSTQVLKICPPPALHLMMGVVNKIIDGILVHFPPLESWLLENLHITREDYHGKNYEGNECNKILKNLMMFRDVLPPHLLCFWDSLYDLNNVLNSCFGLKLDTDYNIYIEKLDLSIQILCQDFNFPITNKIHIILKHVPEFIALEGKSLGEFSEQVVESSHYCFEQTFEKYKVKDTGCEEFGANLLRSILDFNSNHI